MYFFLLIIINVYQYHHGYTNAFLVRINQFIKCNYNYKICVQLQNILVGIGYI